MGDSSDDKDNEKMTFEEELEVMGFDDKSVKKLKDSGFSSVADLALLAEEEDAVKDLKLSLAQRLLLKREVRMMSGCNNSAGAMEQQQQGAAGSAPVHVPAAHEATTLSHVLGELRRDGSGGPHISVQHTASSSGPGVGVEHHHHQPVNVTSAAGQRGAAAHGITLDLLQTGTAMTQSADPQIYLRGGCDPRATKVHEIVDYIHLVPPVVEEQVVSEQGEAQFIYRNAPRKPKLHSITVEEWCLANTRIMDGWQHTQRLYVLHHESLCTV